MRTSSWQLQVVEVARDLEALVRARHARLAAITLAAPARLPRRAIVQELAKHIGLPVDAFEVVFVDSSGPLRVIAAEFEPVRRDG